MGKAAGFHIHHIAIHQGVHQVEIVDHQVQNSGNVIAASGPGATAPALDFQRGFGLVQKAGAGENKTFLVANRQDQAGLGGQRHKVIGFFDGGGDGLFHQYMRAGIQESADDFGMGDGRRADADQIHLAQKVAPVGHGQHAGRGGAAHIGAGIGNGEEFNILPGFGQSAVFGGVVAAKSASTDHGGFQGAIFRHAAA